MRLVLQRQIAACNSAFKLQFAQMHPILGKGRESYTLMSGGGGGGEDVDKQI